MGKKRKEKDKIIFTSIGASTCQVTGSCWKFEYKLDNGESKVSVIECGLPQGSPTIEQQYKDAKRMTEAVKGGGLISGCDNLFLLHPH